MAEEVSLEQVAILAAHLPPAERRQLAEQILRELESSDPVQPPRRRSWREIRGIVAYPFLGEDAQAWINRTRRESDEQRERQWRRGS